MRSRKRLTQTFLFLINYVRKFHRLFISWYNYT